MSFLRNSAKGHDSNPGSDDPGKEAVIPTGFFRRCHEIAQQLSGLLELYVHAYYAPKSEKHALLVKDNIQLEIIRHYFRLGYDLGLYASTQYQYFAEVLHEIGNMTGGWIKSLESRT